jgi:hypothetical protein
MQKTYILSYHGSHALRMPGNLGLGPLDEKAATLGANTCFPSILYTGEILTSGVLLSDFVKKIYIMDQSQE